MARASRAELVRETRGSHSFRVVNRGVQPDYTHGESARGAYECSGLRVSRHVRRPAAAALISAQERGPRRVWAEWGISGKARCA